MNNSVAEPANSALALQRLADDIICYVRVKPERLQHGMLLRDIRGNMTDRLVEDIQKFGWHHVSFSFI